LKFQTGHSKTCAANNQPGTQICTETHSFYICAAVVQVWHEQQLQQALLEVAGDLTDELCGLVADFEEVWFVEELDLLALGLRGRYVKHAAQLRCPGV
jgi:hypothetical protein